MLGQHGGPPPRPRSPTEVLQPRRAPEPPERESGQAQRHPILATLNRLLTAALIIGCGLVALMLVMQAAFNRPGPLPAPVVLVIPQGEGVSAIADQLVSHGVISDRRLFVGSVIYFNSFKHKTSLKAGEYAFPAHMSMRGVLDTLVRGKGVVHKVTLAEGLTSQEVVGKLLAASDLTGDIKQVPPEGSLLPDTYQYQRGDTRQSIVTRMQKAQKAFLAKVWPKRAPGLVLTTPEQAVILASIVEKETGLPNERPMIAAVFENRLKKKMRLQSDPTIIYGLVGGKGSLGRPLMESEIEKPTPYNTYQINGLPPTPICNPGRASILAVLNPAKTDDLYFVANGTGGHSFAVTLAQHDKNVAKWRKVQKEREAAAKAEAGSNPVATDLPAEVRAAAGGASSAAPASHDKAASDGIPPLPEPNPRFEHKH